MNPEDNQYSIDYLNQIAPQQKKSGLGNRLFFAIIGGGILLAVIVGFFALSSGAGGPTEKMQTLAARLITLQSVADKSQKTIKSGTLRSTNSNLAIFLTNANRDIVDPLKNNGITIEKIDKKITAAENGDKLTKTLEDARLNAVFDRVYAREMGYQLDTVASLMTEIYDKSNSKSLKEFMVATDKNLEPIKKQLTDFNAANL